MRKYAALIRRAVNSPEYWKQYAKRLQEMLGESRQLIVARAIVVACAFEMAQFMNPYPKGSPAYKAFKELASSVEVLRRSERKQRT